MNVRIKEDIGRVLRKLHTFLSRKKVIVSDVKELSDRTIHNASVFQDEDSISTAVLVYALSKILDRDEDFDLDDVRFRISETLLFLDQDDARSFRRSMKDILDVIKQCDSQLNLYIEEVISQAQIKKGSKLCAHCISVERASNVLGVSQWELRNYIGKTAIHDRFEGVVNVSRRLNHTRELFSKK